MDTEKFRFVCVKCAYQTNRKQDYERHTNTQKCINNQKNTDDGKVCTYCLKTFATQWTMRRHLNICPAKNNENNEDDIDYEKEVAACQPEQNNGISKITGLTQLETAHTQREMIGLLRDFLQVNIQNNSNNTNSNNDDHSVTEASNNNNNTNSNNTVTNNIYYTVHGQPSPLQINDFDKPNLTFMDRERILRAVANGLTPRIGMFNEIYASPDHPENHSITSANSKTGQCRVVYGNKGTFTDIDTTCQTIRQSNINAVEGAQRELGEAANDLRTAMQVDSQQYKRELVGAIRTLKTTPPVIDQDATAAAIASAPPAPGTIEYVIWRRDALTARGDKIAELVTDIPLADYSKSKQIAQMLSDAMKTQVRFERDKYDKEMDKIEDVEITDIMTIDAIMTSCDAIISNLETWFDRVIGEKFPKLIRTYME